MKTRYVVGLALILGMASFAEPPATQPQASPEIDDATIMAWVKARRRTSQADRGYVDAADAKIVELLMAEIDALKDRVNDLETAVLDDRRERVMAGIYRQQSPRQPIPMVDGDDARDFQTWQQTRILQDMLRQQQMEEIRRRKPNGWPDNVPYPR